MNVPHPMALKNSLQALERQMRDVPSTTDYRLRGGLHKLNRNVRLCMPNGHRYGL
jgi:hypothetical protein